MNILDALAIVIVGILSFIGFMKGFFSKMLEIVIFLLSSAAAYICYRNGVSLFGIMLTLAVANIALHLFSWVIMKMVFKNKVNVSLASRIAGGAVGGMEGVILVLLTLVLLHLTSGTTGAANSLIADTLGTSSLYAGYKAMSIASSFPAVKKIYEIGEKLKAREGKVVLDEREVSKLREHPSIQAMLTDEQLVESINRRDYGKIIVNPKFLAILNDMKLLKQILGVVVKEDVPDITKDDSAKDKVHVPEKSENYLAGIVYLKGSRAAFINNTIYRAGSQILGGRITEITESTITVEFPDKSKRYSIGDIIS